MKRSPAGANKIAWNEHASGGLTCCKAGPGCRTNTSVTLPEEEIAMSQQILDLVETSSLKDEVPQFAIGDTVDVHTRILEGDKERIQVFSGVVIARNGSGSREMFTVRRIVANEGVERKFPLHSPRIAKVDVKRSGLVRRAKLYFLRGRVGKAVRLKERRRDV
jgi:large subunit ribosomal protein L19